MDFHEDIHRAVDAYHDENEFRRNLNSALQNSRSVTFLLQKRKSKWPDFDDWYGTWTEVAANNEVLTWGIRSRNRVVKEEDLLTFSVAEVAYYGPRLKVAEEVMLVPPQTTVEMMLSAFKDLISKEPADQTGTLRITRKWVDDQLPQYEVIAALCELYRAVATIVATAHRKSGVQLCSAPQFSRSCVNATIEPTLTCFSGGSAIPSLLLDAATGEVSHIRYYAMERDESIAAVGLQRYGAPPVFGGGPLEDCQPQLELSKQLLEADGYAGPILRVYDGTNSIGMGALTFDQKTPREMKVDAMADQFGAQHIDGVLYASEIWLRRPGAEVSSTTAGTDVPAGEGGFYDADAIGGAAEALAVMAFTEAGTCRTLILPFKRTAGSIEYGALHDADSPGQIPLFLLRPFVKRWIVKH